MLSEPDSGTQHTIQFRNQDGILISSVCVALIDGKPHRAIDEGDGLGMNWEPCTWNLYNAILMECIGSLPG